MDHYNFYRPKMEKSIVILLQKLFCKLIMGVEYVDQKHLLTNHFSRLNLDPFSPNEFETE